ncbi:MAG TPA: DNA polymerase Y family protein [Candidatus Solibacter sp.]|nr:DNA polymerase Y family protein [Candidatus Solibacter sp.]
MPFACLLVPCFPVQVVVRAEPELRRLKLDHAAIAVVDGAESMMRVIACNEAAGNLGVHVGMTKAQAEQHSNLVIKKRSAAQEESSQSALLDCAFSFSPRVESTAPGIATLDIRGLEKLFGPPGKLGSALVDHAAAMGFDANVAIAGNPDATLIAAQGISGVTVVPHGKEAAYLSHLPVDVLRLSLEQAEILDSWGIRTCRALAQLPPVPLTERLGQEGLRLQRLARGELQRTLVPFDSPLKFEEQVEFDDPIELIDPLLFVLNRLLDHMDTRLRARSLSTQELKLELGLELHPDRNVGQSPARLELAGFERTIRLPVPTHDMKTLLKLLQLDLESHPPNGPVRTMKLTAEPAQPRFTQANLFVRTAPEPEKIEVLQARLRAVVGETDQEGRNTVGSPELINSHKPDSFTVVPAFAETKRQKKSTTRQKTPAQQKTEAQQEEDLLRIYRPPKPATVRELNGRPQHISFANAAGTIGKVSGPWRCSGQWWKKKWEQEIWDIELPVNEGWVRYRIYHDLLSNCWAVAGKFN